MDSAEIASLWGQSKVALVDELARRLLVLGGEYAEASAVHHRNRALGQKDADADARYYRLQIEHDTLEHVISALQSTLKIERLGVYREA